MQQHRKTALITGIAGQDGSYLCELLLEKGYQVAGTVRDPARDSKALPNDVLERVRIMPGSDISQDGWNQLIRETKPDEVYNLSGVSFVPATANEPSRAAEEIALPAIRLLQAVRDFSPETRVYQACSSEMFGSRGPYPQNEETALSPTSPYGAAKVYTYFSVEQFKSIFGIFATAGIAYNHESERRPPRFVSRRITQGAAMIRLGMMQTLKLGNLDAKRDWGYAKDYVRAMWLMLQQPSPESYVLATGKLHTVRDIVEIAFGELGLRWRDHIELDQTLLRPDESRPLVGDAGKARRNLGWSTEVPFDDLIRRMVRADFDLLRR